LPRILPQGLSFGPLIGDLHTLASYLLLGVVGLHALAALYHHFVRRDGTLARMLPRIGYPRAPSGPPNKDTTER